MSTSIPAESKATAALQKLTQELLCHVQDLRRQAAITRTSVQLVTSDLVKYCNDHMDEDGLMGKKPNSENPFIERDCCRPL